MSEELQPQTTLRDALEANVAEAEAGTLPTNDEAREARARDEAGRFAPKPKEEVAPVLEAQPAVQQPQQQRPTTWKKEYLPIYDKLAAGQALTSDEAKKLAEYTNQRENEYKTGVSTYKTEADNAKHLQEAITPFLPELQAHGIEPAQWIKNLGAAHYTLTKGSPDQKLQMFRTLAQQYGVPIGAILQNPQQVPTIVHELMGEIAALKNQFSSVDVWRQSQESNSLTSEIDKYAKDTQNYPHFEAVRGTMAQILESGFAQDIPTAYTKAIRMQDDVWEAEQLRLTQQSSRAGAVVKAKAAAVSPRSATPSGQVATSGAKDRRSQLEESFDSAVGGRV